MPEETAAQHWAAGTSNGVDALPDVRDLTVQHATLQAGESCSFPEGDPFLLSGSPEAQAEVLVLLGIPCGARRIVDRLVQPKYNAALRFLHEGLATAVDMDLTCRLGLGYPDGPIERVVRGGLIEHHDVTRALFQTYGTSAYAPARHSVVAAARRGRGR